MDPKDNDTSIDPELWLRVLMDFSADPKERDKLVQRLSQNSGVSPEKTDEILHVLLETLLDITRSN